REPGNGGIDLTGDNYDLAFIFQFYDDDGIFAFTENFDDRVKVVATPITGSTNLTATGASAEHSDVGWNARTYGNFDFGAGGWFNVDIWLTEDGGGAQSAADIGFGYFNGASSNTADFGGVGYTGAFGVSSGAPAVFDTDGNGESWGVYIQTEQAEEAEARLVNVFFDEDGAGNAVLEGLTPGETYHVIGSFDGQNFVPLAGGEFVAPTADLTVGPLVLPFTTQDQPKLIVKIAEGPIPAP
ncbi:MAG: hypothetical protein MK194_15880, partial [Roseibacillus sp.]|nr:hypothetical protein [Roseibacillus sp.]